MKKLQTFQEILFGLEQKRKRIYNYCAKCKKEKHKCSN